MNICHVDTGLQLAPYSQAIEDQEAAEADRQVAEDPDVPEEFLAIEDQEAAKASDPDVPEEWDPVTAQSLAETELAEAIAESGRSTPWTQPGRSTPWTQPGRSKSRNWRPPTKQASAKPSPKRKLLKPGYPGKRGGGGSTQRSNISVSTCRKWLKWRPTRWSVEY